MSDWGTKSVGDLSEMVSKGTTPREFATQDSSVINFIKAQSIDDSGRFVREKIVFIDEQTNLKLKRSILQKCDILLTIAGTIGRVAIVTSNELPANCNQAVAFIRLFDKSQKHFVYYALKSRQVQNVMMQSVVEAVQPNLSLTEIKGLEIPYPPREEQEAIAEVLSSLDDKIDLLKRQNKTLEGMAEALFRQWFIEEAQDDWEEVELQDLYKIKIGRTPPRKESEWFEDIESSQNWPWFSIKDMADCGTFISNSSEFITSEGQEKFKIPVIPPRTVVLSFKLTVGRVAITKRPMLSNEAIAHFIPSTTAPSDLVLFCFLKSLNYQSLGSTSSIAQAVNSGTIRKIQMPKFPQSVINRFDVLCSQWFDKINYNQEQLKVLKNKRSTLLPKLMSGEVRVQMD